MGGMIRRTVWLMECRWAELDTQIDDCKIHKHINLQAGTRDVHLLPDTNLLYHSTAPAGTPA